MTKVLNRLRIQGASQQVQFGERYVEVKQNQILVWVSIHLPGTLRLESTIPRIPALLDSGNNFHFTIQERHLHDWAGIHPRLLVHLGKMKIDHRVVDRRAASLWIYPNITGGIKAAVDKEPFLLELPRGIAIYPREKVPSGPRLPLLGLFRPP